MCKFCDNPENYVELCSYNNGVGYNEKFGIGISAWIGMQGNMLRLSAAGNRWTKADDYYEDEGLEVEGESAVRGDDAIMKFNYCPFCGKKLMDKTYENEIKKREIPVIEKNLVLLNKYKNYWGCCFRIQEYKNNIEKLKDKATIFIPHFSSERMDIISYGSSSKSICSFDYDGMLPFSFSDWDLRYTLPYDKDIFMGLGDKEFSESWEGHQRHTNILLFKDMNEIEDLFDSIGENNIRWKWNREKTLKEINEFHNDVMNKIKELEDRKSEINNMV